MLFINNVCKNVVTLFGTLRLLLSINKAVRGGKFHTYWSQQPRVIIASIDPLKSKLVPCVKDITEPITVSNEEWKINNTYVKVSCWADDIGHTCEEYRQQQLMIRSGHTKALFEVFIHWLLRDKLNGFTLMAQRRRIWQSLFVLLSHQWFWLECWSHIQRK